jgi:Cof subfamily protein (haloacid dehalogenase superfamily)
MPVRLIALDLDGTLLDNGKNVPEENRDALRSAADEGVLIVLASGRMTDSIAPYAEVLGIDTRIMGYNGARVVGPVAEGRPVLFHRPLQAEYADDIIDFHETHEVQLNYYLDEKLYSRDDDAMRPLAQLYADRTKSVVHYVESLQQFKGNEPTKLILLAENERRNELYDRFRPELDGRVKLIKTDPEYLELLNRDIDKGIALKGMCETLGIPVEETMAFGDGDNDAEMIATAGIGVAMANASDASLAAADYVTERDHNAAGVAEAVEKFVLRKKGDGKRGDGKKGDT